MSNVKIVESRRGEEDNDVLFISETVVRRLLNWNDCVDAMESALVAMVKKTPDNDQPFSTQTPRSFTSVNDKGVLLTMPGYAANYNLKTVNEKRHSTLACKLVTSFGGNSQLTPPLPTILATILLFDAVTGKLRAVVEGTEITAWRTAAVSVAATKFLFYNHVACTMGNDERKMTLSIVGTGTQVLNLLLF
jgi:thiomorpholine-carboxylate dehydrogenase